MNARHHCGDKRGNDRDRLSRLAFVLLFRRVLNTREHSRGFLNRLNFARMRAPSTISILRGSPRAERRIDAGCWLTRTNSSADDEQPRIEPWCPGIARQRSIQATNDSYQFGLFARSRSLAGSFCGLAFPLADW
jgi:hypothetical protein